MGYKASMWTRALADCDATCGGKAHGLARLLAAGFRVPDGFAVSGEAFRWAAGLPEALPLDALGAAFDEAATRIAGADAVPVELRDEVLARARALGGPFVVRSSAALEDGEAGAAAGVFASRTAVELGELWPAIRAVWASALTPLVASYARRRAGRPPVSTVVSMVVDMVVIVQREVTGERAVLYTRPPGDPGGGEMWLQRDGRVERLERGSLAERLERAIAADRGADVELVLDPAAADALAGAWFVQARPIVHPSVHPAGAAPRTPPPPAVLAPLEDGRIWTWDVRHNPDPLSPAQASLVERVEQARIAPWSMRLCAGYLYTAPHELEPVAPPAGVDELARRAAAIEQRLARIVEVAHALPLAEAIERYLAFQAIWAGELSPMIAAVRDAVPAGVGERPSSVEATLLAAARGDLDEADAIAELGVLAPAWDVAVPTFAERPGAIRDAIARARLVVAGAEVAAPRDSTAADAGSAAANAGPRGAAAADAAPRDAADDDATTRDDDATTRDAADDDATPRDDDAADAAPRDAAAADARPLALAAADLAERDDRWFARAQWLVRRAILERARQLGIAEDDACWLSLDDLLGTIDPIDARRRAAGSRAAAERAARWSMPLVVGGPAPESGPPLVGIGTGPRTSGRVVRYASLASAIAVGPRDVVVARAITPALAVLVVGCAALISETGGPLDHGAALARELGIPCVVGCRDAWSLLADGMIVTVDGDAGVVLTS